MDYRRTFRSAAIAYAGLVANLPPERLDEPGLGDWTLRELLGHTAGSALRQVPEVLATRAPQVDVETTEGFFAYAREAEQVIAAEELGEQPAEQISTLIGRATAALSQVNDDDLVLTAAGGMRVRDWIPTRTFELVVHGLDAAAATGLDLDLPVETVAESVRLAYRSALALGAGVPLLRALTGREPLPPGFTIV
ncbi:maleylpyruvate isomerase family mycothiol-dependent enzyme [Actinoplanes palleronii]|uniref:Mycothiol-dependent maleylpyruvate isomerase metal-binding domain-containing protein n=1 Tax=Actinoplanes palleronii TaxID=113570 RepID=A0ABQ4AZW8_9ACTN|nr:maleylpyruvate isomerase N-terminal domain-containing protein [Actinoplanes palleronii]GIE63974.1 hypothetical protein Apa02nite_000820 [Actinoplanes palleronii]